MINKINFMRLMTDRFMRGFVKEHQWCEWVLTGTMPSEGEVRKKFGVKPALTLEEMSKLSVGESG